MTSRERVLGAVNFTGPDKIPFIHCHLPAALQIYPKLKQLLAQYPSDIVGEGNMSADNPLYKKGEWLDEWGCTWTVLHDGLLGQVTGHPLYDDNSINNYKWPNAYDSDISEDIETIEANKDKLKYARAGWITLFEQMINLRGFENTMEDIYNESSLFMDILDKISDFNMNMIDRLADLDVDCISFADDWGTQLNMMVSPKLWEKYFLPKYQDMFAKVRSAGKHVFFHSDGYTMPILSKLVDAGVNIFWVDMTVNPIENLVKELGGKVCFQGLTDVQFIMHQASPEKIKEYAKRLMYLFGRYNGGFIACSEIDPDQPWDNIKAIIETFNNCGNYPLVIEGE
jgi:uroporphyrinogen decarboxylase